VKTFEEYLSEEQVTPMKAINVAAARKEAKTFSAKNRGWYITIGSAFGLFMHKSKTLHRFSPTDAVEGLRYYYLNGKEKPFSEKQKLRDQISSPTMA